MQTQPRDGKAALNASMAQCWEQLAEAYSAFCGDAANELRAIEAERRTMRSHARTAGGSDGVSTLELWRVARVAADTCDRTEPTASANGAAHAAVGPR